jgi:cobalt/nickel transport protein
MSATRSVMLLAAATAIVAAPLVMPGLKGEFKGADDLVTEAILASRPDYKPWFEPLWKPPSDEVETMFFALQAALGAGVLGYVIGRRHSNPGRNADRR